MCSQLSDMQRHLFNFFMEYLAEYKYAVVNDKPEPEPFDIFLSVGTGVEKSFLINVMTEYAKRILKYPGQSLQENQPLLLWHQPANLHYISMAQLYILYLSCK